MSGIRSSEKVLKEEALSIASIQAAANASCPRTSPHEGWSFRCEGHCRFAHGSKDGSNDYMVRLIQAFRRDLWPEYGNCSVRKAVLTEKLFSDSVLRRDGSGRDLIFRIGGARVCRGYYFAATGVHRKMFSECCSEVADARESLKQEVCIGAAAAAVPGMSDADETALIFLDQFFNDSTELKRKDVNSDPARPDAKTTRLTWRYIYKEFYLPFVKHFPTSVDYNHFVAIRKKYRPNYQRDRKARSGGWTHLGCSACDAYRLKIKNAKKKRQRNKVVELQGRYAAHLESQEKLRQQYKHRRVKTLLRRPSKCYGSAIIDATSSLGSSFMPHAVCL